jgi:nucleotidyltransferase/DNA polymerase involved in DNA repair
MVEPLSLDEAYLDVTQNKGNPSASLFGGGRNSIAYFLMKWELHQQEYQ